jgi:hypothetical protein
MGGGPSLAAALRDSLLFRCCATEWLITSPLRDKYLSRAGFSSLENDIFSSRPRWFQEAQIPPVRCGVVASKIGIFRCYATKSVDPVTLRDKIDNLERKM